MRAELEQSARRCFSTVKYRRVLIYVGIWSMGGVAHEIHNVEVATAGPMESMYLSRPEECGVLL